MMLTSTVTVYTSNGTWVKTPTLHFVDVVLRGAGGGGAQNVGGGGGVAIEKRIMRNELPNSLTVTVGVGGTSGEDGTQTKFGEICIAENGGGGIHGGAGGVASYMRGGSGGANGLPGESVSSEFVRLLSGGGGGAGLGAIGGRSGMVPANVSSPPLWQWIQSGGGGNSGQPGGFPAGGGGAGARGANGVCTVIEYHREG